MTEIFTPPERRIAIVTGAARGIGAAIARRLAEEGHDVAALDLDAEACAATVANVKAAGRRGLAVAGDVSDEASVERAMEAVVQQLGAPTVLVNNAGILRDRTLAKMSLEDWQSAIDVNLRSVFLMSRAVQPHMRAARWGRIVNMSSIAALGALGEVNYSAAKAGIQGLTKTLAIELGRHGITANAVAPGFIVTDMTRAVAERMGMAFDDMVTQQLQSIHVGHPGTPEDIANAVAWFVDPRSSFITGQVIYVAGAPRG